MENYSPEKVKYYYSINWVSNFKNSSPSKTSLRKYRVQPQGVRKYLKNKDFISRTHKELLPPKKSIIKNYVIKMGKTL